MPAAVIFLISPVICLNERILRAFLLPFIAGHIPPESEHRKYRKSY